MAARGIDITGIPFVVNVTLPDEKQNYVHRIGRVGRADRMGLAISLVAKVKEKACVLCTCCDLCLICPLLPSMHASDFYIPPSPGCQVWYHTCPGRGKGCWNTRLVENGGCAIWYNEPQYLADIEEHLGVSVPTVDSQFNVPVNEFDGKVCQFQSHPQAMGLSWEWDW